MTLKLYGYFIASGTQRVAVVLHEKNVPFELIPIDLTKGEQKSPEVKKYQPFGLTPYIVLVPLFAPEFYTDAGIRTTTDSSYTRIGQSATTSRRNIRTKVHL